MRKTSILKILLILSISITCLFIWTASGICIDKTRIDLSEYRGLTSRTFTAYKYAFGGLTMGTLQLVIDPREFGFNMEWNEVYDDGVAQFLAFDYEDTAEGSFERNIVRYEVLYDWPNPPTKGDEIYRANYRDPAPPGVAGTQHPVLVFPYLSVAVGYMWGDGFIEKKRREDVNSPRVYQYAILGLDDVTIDDADGTTFTDCVKIARFRGNQSDRIAWYAKGMGLVKMVYAQDEHPFATIQGYNRAFVLRSLDN